MALCTNIKFLQKTFLFKTVVLISSQSSPHIALECNSREVLVINHITTAFQVELILFYL